MREKHTGLRPECVTVSAEAMAGFERCHSWLDGLMLWEMYGDEAEALPRQQATVTSSDFGLQALEVH